MLNAPIWFETTIPLYISDFFIYLYSSEGKQTFFFAINISVKQTQDMLEFFRYDKCLNKKKIPIDVFNSLIYKVDFLLFLKPNLKKKARNQTKGYQFKRCQKKNEKQLQDWSKF